MNAACGRRFHVVLEDRVLPVCVFVPEEFAGWYSAVRVPSESGEVGAQRCRRCHATDASPHAAWLHRTQVADFAGLSAAFYRALPAFCSLFPGAGAGSAGGPA